MLDAYYAQTYAGIIGWSLVNSPAFSLYCLGSCVYQKAENLAKRVTHYVREVFSEYFSI